MPSLNKPHAPSAIHFWLILISFNRPIPPLRSGGLNLLSVHVLDYPDATAFISTHRGGLRRRPTRAPKDHTPSDVANIEEWKYWMGSPLGFWSGRRKVLTSSPRHTQSFRKIV